MYSTIQKKIFFMNFGYFFLFFIYGNGGEWGDGVALDKFNFPIFKKNSLSGLDFKTWIYV